LKTFEIFSQITLYRKIIMKKIPIIKN